MHYEEDQLKRPLKSIGDELKKRELNRPKDKGPNSHRAYNVEQLMWFMGEKSVNNSKRFKYWLGRTRKLSPGRIYDLMGIAKNGNHRQKLFNYLLKKENAKYNNTIH